MAYLDHIAACNAHDIDRFLPFFADRRHVGWVRDDHAPYLAAHPDIFRLTGDTVSLHPRLTTPAMRTQAVAQALTALAPGLGLPAPRGEWYAAGPGWNEPSLFSLDRAYASLFGIRAFGIHVNGIVRRPDGLFLWIGRRAMDRPVAPGQLDNMIAGGQPAGLGLIENLVKEAAEEAAVPEALARTARPVGAITYCLEDEWGLKPDTMFCFDLELSEDFIPRNTDGEITGFELMPVDEAAARVRTGNDFKFNVNLVLLDFLIRHGCLTPDEEPDYIAIVRGLRRGW